MADVKKKQLVYNIIEFLRTSEQDGTIKEDDKESLEVAIQCIAEAFEVDPESESDKSQYSIAPASLLSILDVFLKTRAKTGAGQSQPGASASSSSSTGANTGRSSSGEPSEADRKKAEELKTKGNALMGQKLYDSAIEQYTQAIKLDPNPVYYSNRAAAWGGLGEHEKAVDDAERALSLDPKFAKAYSRLGHAQFSLGEYSAAIEAYESGLKLDPSNANMKTALSTAKARYAEQGGSDEGDLDAGVGSGGGARAGAGAGGMPDLSSLASMLGGAGGGAGGMPDIASMMRNPQMMAMAQQMMANGGLERLMANPQMRQMAERYQSGGGMPSMSELANDPSLREMAQQFMGGRGGPPPGNV
ncbi:hypothetical protein BD324DRAFT_581766 [Kockovaella imperatae]|uniref:SGTA homodimerisation domain-containing protein n=1 Tax=Kockovaella imperatae TaxID=4999 RepID=A0A1Y1UE31_9TREE|nr:hypothetical protein BD324DRAFT_581766 [Kockovaella imperatae]ORX35797.1 hypothetical protein BD324DRAFT_581766 [Kockovaella imperatae]